MVNDSIVRVLGIETSCDETAAAVVVEEGNLTTRVWKIDSSVVASQVDIHREWGGVVPELASRQHVRDICGVVEKALDDACTTWSALDAVAVTQGPGLVGSLLVGVAFAKTLSFSLEIPLLPVHHLAGHIESLFLENGNLPLPAVVLVVSGGHTNLYVVRELGDYAQIGRTRDDAAGEAFDKVAKLLDLSYPGGPIIDQLAREGDNLAIDFPIARMTHVDRNAAQAVESYSVIMRQHPGRFDFSFSGLKTAVKRYVQARKGSLGSLKLSSQEIADICASFQRAVIKPLLGHTCDAALTFGARSIGIAGGVSANSQLRLEAHALGNQVGLPVFFPSLALSTDNAAMIAAGGLRQFHHGVSAPLGLNAEASLPL